MLDTIFFFMFLTGLPIGFAYFLGWYYASPSRQDATHMTTTSDGWRLAVHHYEGATQGDRAPVILCHGLSSNRFIFDMEGAPSLACHLRDAGYDVWVPELRGSGMSDAPGLLRSASPYSWGFDDHLDYDVPAIIDLVIMKTGAPQVKWVGHSMGGMLIDCHMARTADPRVSSVITLGAPIDFSKMDNHAFKGLLRFKSVLKYVPVNPLPFMGRLLAPFVTGTPDFVHGLYYKSNIAPNIARKVSCIGTQLVSSSRLWIDMARFLQEKCLRLREGTPVLETLHSVKTPLFVVAGSKDAVGPPECVIGAANAHNALIPRELLIAGKDRGFEEDYGHIDLLLGLRAHTEVYPALQDWLERY